VTYPRYTTAISEFTGHTANTWTEEWRIETEPRAILKMPKEERDAFFNSRKDENGASIDRGVIAVRGLKAAKNLKALIVQLEKAQATEEHL